jgi:hypothetical protein
MAQLKKEQQELEATGVNSWVQSTLQGWLVKEGGQQ